MTCRSLLKPVSDQQILPRSSARWLRRRRDTDIRSGRNLGPRILQRGRRRSPRVLSRLVIATGQNGYRETYRERDEISVSRTDAHQVSHRRCDLA